MFDGYITIFVGFIFQAEKQIQYQLFRLFYIERDIQRLTNEMQEKQKELTTVEQNKEKADEILKEKKKESGKITRELAELEQKIRVVVSNAFALYSHLTV